MAKSDSTTPKIVSLHVKNYRALQDVKLQFLPLTVLLGPNGSGKSTVFDVFAFLSKCFNQGLREAVDSRGRFKELRSRGQDGPIVIEVAYREPGYSKVTYHLEIQEEKGRPVVAQEWLRWTRGKGGQPFKFLDFSRGVGKVISGDKPDAKDERIEEQLEAPDVLAVNALGQLKRHPRVMALRRFITGWHLSYLTADHTRGQPEAGPQEHLSQTGDNLPNVIQYLSEQHQEHLNDIYRALSQRIPVVERVDADPMADGRLLLRLKDSPFSDPILAKWASDGTLKMLAYLLLLKDPRPAPMIGIEEPENHLHPMLLQPLAEECREATGSSQILVTTHSPFLLNGLRPKEVWVLYRDAKGYTQVKCVDKMAKAKAMLDSGATLGELWMENYLEGASPFDVIQSHVNRKGIA